MDAAGNLYGTTYIGGGEACGGDGCGTVFKLAPDGIETNLYSFSGADGRWPASTLLMDGAANLFGTTIEGGSGCGGLGCGAVFKLAPDGTETVLYSFKGGSDGNWPGPSLIRDQSGNLYGTTYWGGNISCSVIRQHKNKPGCGTVFKLANGGTETVLYIFDDKPLGRGPGSGVIADKHGNLYGSTSYGGSTNCDQGCGTLFKLTP
jgi:uncharacterized repeat protein (TIGR03803 family)